MGTSLLFWGAMTDHALVGLLLALLVEARHWTPLRWDFDLRDCARAWQLTTLALLLTTVLMWLDGRPHTAMARTLVWLPPLLIPMQFVQSYGLRSSMPTSVFSFLARRRHERNLRLGLPEEVTEFHFGNVYFVGTLIAATLGSRADSWAYLPGLLLLCGWMLHHRSRSRVWPLAASVVLAGGAAILGQRAIEHAEEWFGSSTTRGPSRFDPRINHTRIGTRGTVVQSPDIQWRVRVPRDEPTPRLLRIASYQQFLGSNWQNQRSTDEDFMDLESRAVGETAYELLQPAELSTHFPGLPSFELRGSAFEESPLPLPGDAAAVSGFDLDGIERDPNGTVRVYPKRSVINGTVFWNGGTNPEEPPALPEDLRLPKTEIRSGIIPGIVRELRLEQQPDLQTRLSTLRAWFLGEFRYSRKLTIARGGYDSAEPTAIGRFLASERSGHCEYFATSAALILRAAGIPTRYATGFAMMEKDIKRQEWLLRGTHRHAWCRVWDESSGTWIDFDATPPDWFATASPARTRGQVFDDWVQRVREDFFVWRNQPGNRVAVTTVMWIIGAAVAGFVAIRLWRSRRREETRSAVASYSGDIVRTPLHDLEPRAAKILGPRGTGESFATWLHRLRPVLTEPAPLDEAIRLHQRLRFDPHPAPQDQLAELQQLSKLLDRSLRRR